MSGPKQSDREESVPHEGDGEQESVSLAGGQSLILPGGKVDADALRRAVESAAEGAEGEDDTELRRVRFDIKSLLNKRLDKYLTDRITFMSRNQLQKLIDEGGVSVNGREPKRSTVLHRGDVVEVLVPTPPPKNIQPEDIPLDVLFEDEHIIVLNKQPDIIVHPARSHLKGTMLSALAYHFKHRSKVGGGLSNVGEEFARPGVVHRLDRHTSGVIVFAKTEEAHWKLGHQFEHRRVDKRYLAVVQGIIETPADVIDLPLGPHPSREKGYREKYVVRHDELGKPSVTICRVRELYGKPSDEATERRGDAGSPGWKPAPDPDPSSLRRSVASSLSSGFSLVELELKTGRTHQIRVHLSHTGYPIVGDDMYGGKPYEVDGKAVIARQALHATTLSIFHPVTGAPMTFSAPLRGDMADLVRALRQLPGHEVLNTPGTTIDLAKVAGV